MQYPPHLDASIFSVRLVGQILEEHVTHQVLNQRLQCQHKLCGRIPAGILWKKLSNLKFSYKNLGVKNNKNFRRQFSGTLFYLFGMKSQR